MPIGLSDFMNALEYGPITLSGWLLPELLDWDRPMRLCVPVLGGRSFITAMMVKEPPPAASA